MTNVTANERCERAAGAERGVGPPRANAYGGCGGDEVPPPSHGLYDAPAIELRDLRKRFGSESVLDGIDLSVAQGEMVAILGRSGTGKSVLLKLIVGLHAPDDGSIQIHGTDIVGLSLDELNKIRAKVGFVFQEAALYDSLTIEDNVAFPLRRQQRLSEGERRDRVHELLTDMGMEEASGKMPSEVSGGMKKRVGIARALALDPDILLFDEPTAGLDPITADEIGEIMIKLKEQRHVSSVVVTHDLRGARTVADRFALLHEGHILIDGSFEELQQSRDEFVSEFMKLGC